MSKDKFKPIPQVIMDDMTDAQRERLVASVSAVIADLRVEDISLLLPLLLENQAAKETILRSIFAFLQNEMQLQIMDWENRYILSKVIFEGASLSLGSYKMPFSTYDGNQNHHMGDLVECIGLLFHEVGCWWYGTPSQMF